MLYERILQASQQLDQEIQKLQKIILSSPDGNLVCCHEGNYCKWYKSNGHVKQYIPKSNRTLAEKLAVKRYYSCVLDELLQEKTALDSYLSLHSTTKESEHLLTLPGYIDLLSPHFQPRSQELSDWMKTSYVQNNSHPEHLLHRTLAGHFVRSKSEALIDSLLFTNKIPFRYECALHLDGLPLYPDFTIRHPQTGKIYYWEHFGLMDDPNYRNRTISKLQLYASNNIIPGIHLITTYETLQDPLTADVIQKIIEHYFL